MATPSNNTTILSRLKNRLVELIETTKDEQVVIRGGQLLASILEETRYKRQASAEGPVAPSSTPSPVNESLLG